LLHLWQDQKAINPIGSFVNANSAGEQAGISSSELFVVKEVFSFEKASDLFETGLNVPLGKTQLPEPMNVAEFLTAVFKQDDCLRKAKSALKQSGFVYYVHARLHDTICAFILTCHDQESDSSSISESLVVVATPATDTRLNSSHGSSRRC
jgi:hypothetical protein